jgi:hypothetical protein
MAKINLSSKHVLISKANTAITIAVAAASFVTVASIMASRAMLQQRAYQSRVIADKTIAAKNLKDNVKAVDTLLASYTEFVSRPKNIIGGSSTGTDVKDGDNAKLTLDALPSKYDFPALATSIEKTLVDNNFIIEQIDGTDDEVAQTGSETKGTPSVVEMPFQFTVKGSYDPMYDLIAYFERSIRPIQVQKLVFTASETNLQLDFTGKTFYQSEKSLNITTKVVK